MRPSRTWRPPWPRHPAMLRGESLESRRLLSVEASGGELAVNTFTVGDQRLSNSPSQAAASDADGDTVVVWNSLGQDGDGWGVFGQRFAADGAAAGAEFRVNATTAGEQRDAVVAIDPDGDFVVAWTGQDGDGLGVFFQRFDAAGNKRGNEFRVNTTTAGDQHRPSVAIDAQGDFVVVWSSLGQDGDQDGVYARLYRADGSPATAEFLVNATMVDRQFDPLVVRDLSGDFAIVWVSMGQDGDAEGVMARRYSADGTPMTPEFPVNQTTGGAQATPSAATNADGTLLIVWQSDQLDGDGSAIAARRFAADGSPVDNEFIVNTTTAGAQQLPAAGISASGDFVIAWSSELQDGDAWGVYAQAYLADGSLTGDEFPVNTFSAGDQSTPSLAMTPNGAFLTVWESAAQDGSGYGIFGQRFVYGGGDASSPLVTGAYLPGDFHALQTGDRAVSAPGALVVAFSESMLNDGGAESVVHPALWQLTLHGQDFSQAISGINFGFNAATNRYEATLNFAAPLANGRYVLRALESLRDVAGNGLDGDYDGAAGGDFALAFDVAVVTPAGGESPINTTTAGDQTFTVGAPGTIAADYDGDYVVTWASLIQDGDGWGIYARAFHADGRPRSEELRVNTTTANHQRFPTVATDADGDFVITWSSLGQDGSNYGVYAQRYSAALEPLGGEFRVNTTTNKFQGRSTVAMDDDGDFVIAWESVDQDGSGAGIYYQRYAADGTPLGVETRANSTTTSGQRLPNVAMDNDGDFVITWSSPPDGSGYGIYARRFNNTGIAQGNEFLVNTLTAGNQHNSSVAMDADGDFVVAWHSSTGDGVLYGVYGQRFTASGEKFGGQFLVNTFTANFQQYPDVAMDANGDFVIVWQSLTQDGGVWGVYGQRYCWGGETVGTEFRVNTATADSQNSPSIAMSDNGDFVVAWESSLQDGGGLGLYSQRFAGVVNFPPQPSAGGPYEIFEGDALTLDAAATTDADFGQTLSYAWDLNGDGQFGDATGPAPTLTSEQLNLLGLADDGEYVVSIQVDDSYGGVATATSTLTVSNASPHSLVVAPVSDVDEGDVIVVDGTFVDAGPADVHTVVIEWGDGLEEEVTLPLGAQSFAISHVMGDDIPTGTMADQTTLRVFVRDDDGAATEPAAMSYQVRNLAPTFAEVHLSKTVLQEGESFTISGRVGDAGVLDTHTVTFHWFDGVDQVVAVDPLTRAFFVEYAYPDDVPSGTNTDLTHFSFTVADDDLAEFTVQAAVTIVNVAPSLANVQVSSPTVDEGGSVAVTGSIVDPGVLDTFTLNVNWGDGVVTPVEVGPLTRTFAATHSYSDDDPSGTAADDFIIALSLADDDLGTATGNTSVRVANSAPSVADLALSATTIDESGSVTLTGRVIDPGVLDTFTLEINWGDGIAAPVEVDPPTRTFSAVHQYIDDDPSGTPFDDYAIALTVSDDDGGVAIAQTAVTVANLPPTAEITSSTPTPTMLESLTLSAVVVDAGAMDMFSYAWQVLFNGEPVAAGDAPKLSFTPRAAGEYSVSLTVVDDDGGTVLANTTLDVAGCRRPGDTNADCVVDLADLNNVRNHFGESGLGIFTLDFAAATPDSLLDGVGLGVGFTHRLPGSGSAIPQLDPNLALLPAPEAALRLRGTAADIAARVNLDVLEAIGVVRNDLGDDDFRVSLHLRNVQTDAEHAQSIMLYAGLSTDAVLMAGVRKGGVLELSVQQGGQHAVLFASPNGAFANGDTLVLALGRQGSLWTLGWDNLTNPAASGSFPGVEAQLFDGAAELNLGVLHTAADESAAREAVIGRFVVDRLAPILGDVDGNHVVDLADLNAVRNNFGASSAPLGMSTAQATPVVGSVGRPIVAAVPAARHLLVDAVFAQLAAADDPPALRLRAPRARKA